MKTAILAGITAALLMGATAFSATSVNDLGEQGDANGVTREVVITPQTRWVNVESVETIKFVDGTGGKSVVWYFDTPSRATWALADCWPSRPGSNAEWSGPVIREQVRATSGHFSLKPAYLCARLPSDRVRRAQTQHQELQRIYRARHNPAHDAQSQVL